MLSLRAYARHRGCSDKAVRRAIDAGRLRQSVSLTRAGPKIADAALADREWLENTLANRVSYRVRIAKGELPPMTEDDQALRDEAARALRFWRRRARDLQARRRKIREKRSIGMAPLRAS
jgi:hypothetical protein